MIAGIMQPYFFPYIGYFSLIEHSDRFIFFDTPQYISHGWGNRNRILKQDGTPGYIIVPIQKAPRETPILEIKVSDREPWREKIFAQLEVYRKRAPYYHETLEFLHSVLDNTEQNLSAINIDTTIATCRYLGIHAEFDTFSAMNLSLGPVSAPDEWALRISQAIHADTYVNPPGGESFFNREKYEEAGIKLLFLKSNLPEYNQKIGHFEPGLSIIDVMMYNDQAAITEMLHDYTLF